jgi:hypothetical protein
MNYTPEEVAKLLANRPNQPHYIAALIAECVDTERKRCAAIAAPESIPYSDDEWRVRCEIRDAILGAERLS